MTRAFVTFALLVVLLVMPATATVAESVDDLIDDAVQLYTTDPIAAKDALYSIATDATIPEACAQWADANLAAMVMIDAGQVYPDSWAVRRIFEWALEAIPVLRNDCVIAI